MSGSYIDIYKVTTTSNNSTEYCLNKIIVEMKFHCREKSYTCCNGSIFIFPCKILRLVDNQTTKASRKRQIIFPLYILLLFHVQPSENFRRGFCVCIFGSNITRISYYPLERIVIQRRDCNYICVNLLIVCCRSGKITKKK